MCWRRGVWVQVECDLDNGFKYGACRRVGRHWLQTCVGDGQTDSGDVADDNISATSSVLCRRLHELPRRASR